MKNSSKNKENYKRGGKCQKKRKEKKKKLKKRKRKGKI